MLEPYNDDIRGGVMDCKKLTIGLLITIVFTFTACSKSSDRDITAFSINNVEGIINDISITVNLPSGTDVTSLVPTISISQDATVSPASGVVKNFTAPLIYTVTAENETTKQYVVMVTTGSGPTPENLCASSTHPTTTFESGSGTKTDPYVICTATQLNLIGDNAHTDRLTKAYKLGADIDMTGVTLVPLSDVDNGFGFNGVFDGNNKSISNITINKPAETTIAFIPILGTGGEVKNLGLENVDISGDAVVGGLVASSNGGIINNCYVTGAVQGNQTHLGGLVGQIENSNIINSYTTGTVTGLTNDAQNTGGLVGVQGPYSYVINSYSTSSVSGDLNVGGLIGQSDGFVINSMATGTVTFVGVADNKAYIGGLIGNVASNSRIYNSYATGAVTGGSFTGGLIGQIYGSVEGSYASGAVSGLDYTGGLSGGIGIDGYVGYSYATGSVSGTDYVGGLVGYNDDGYINTTYSFGETTATGVDVGGLLGKNNSGDCDSSFWNTETSTQSSSDGGIGKNTIQMHTEATYSAESWNFTEVWSMDTSDCALYPAAPSPYLYPCLRKVFFICFTGDTLITMADGKTKRIDEVKKGEKIRSFDGETKISMSTVESVAVRQINEYLVIKTSDNKTIKATKEHPFYAGLSSNQAQFKPIKDFKAGDTLYVNNGDKLNKVKITSISTVKEKIKVYNLHNDDSGPHTFFANGFAVHNK